MPIFEFMKRSMALLLTACLAADPALTSTFSFTGRLAQSSCSNPAQYLFHEQALIALLKTAFHAPGDWLASQLVKRTPKPDFADDVIAGEGTEVVDRKGHEDFHRDGKFDEG